ncbi:MAG TPA: DMT family transporter [Candidatus Dormibacteraeota bacterium]|nr:DMT family transporter [Candidatus Dormibacteraeota bacterium]
MRLGDWALMGVVALTWSGGWIAGKVADQSAPPLAWSAARFLAAGAILLALSRATGAGVPWSRWPALLALAITGIVGYNALVFIGLLSAPASDGGLLVPTFTPALATVLAALFAAEPLRRESIVGLGLSVAGVALVVVGGAGIANGSESRLLGDVLILGGGMCWALYTVIGKHVLRFGSPLGVTAAASFAGGVLLVPLAVVEGRLGTLATWSTETWTAIAYMVLFPTVIGFVGFYRSVVRIGAGRAALTSYMVPVGTLILAALLLGERVTPLQLAGGALTLVGMRIATLPERDAFWLRRLVGI